MRVLISLHPHLNACYYYFNNSYFSMCELHSGFDLHVFSLMISDVEHPFLCYWLFVYQLCRYVCLSPFCLLFNQLCCC